MDHAEVKERAGFTLSYTNTVHRQHSLPLLPSLWPSLSLSHRYTNHLHLWGSNSIHCFHIVVEWYLNVLYS